jgi:F0F1-type ATP synthase membrane subunit b/b'
VKDKPQPSQKEEGNLHHSLENAAQLRQRIQQQLKGKTLPPPEEVIAKMREERTQELLSSYQQMAQDKSREVEALEWAEALISDVNSEEE